MGFGFRLGSTGGRTRRPAQWSFATLRAGMARAAAMSASCSRLNSDMLPGAGLAAGGLALTVAAGPIFGFSDRAADEVLDRGQYISAVLGTRL